MAALEPSTSGRPFEAAAGAVFGGRNGSAGAGMAVGKQQQQQFLNPQDIHVLVVDDDRMARTIVSSLLRKCCYKVTVADSGVTAIETLRTSQPGTFNLVLTDLVMPEVDGLDLLRYVREDENLRTVPVVMMSASEQSENIFECIKDGAEDYLLKPLKPKEVEYIWQHVWRRQQSAGIVPRLGCDEEDYFDAAPRLGVLVPAADACHASEPAFLQRSSRAADASSSQAATAAAVQPVGVLSSIKTSHQQQQQQQQEQAAQAQQQKRQQAADARRDLSTWLARRHHLDTSDAFEVFCRLISLLKAYHLQAKPFGRLRPSLLGFSASGCVDELPSLPETDSSSGGSGAVSRDEEKRYASPEEAAGEAATPASDVFSLGVLFADLFYTVGLDGAARAELLRDVRAGALPAAAACKPEEAAFLSAALARDPGVRLKLIDLIYSDTLPRLLASLSTPARGGQAETRSGAGGAVSVPTPASAAAAAAVAAAVSGPGTHAAGLQQRQQLLRHPRTLLTFLSMMRTTVSVDAAGVRSELALLDADILHARRVLAARRLRAQQQRAVAAAGAAAAPGRQQQLQGRQQQLQGLKRSRSGAAAAEPAAGVAAATAAAPEAKRHHGGGSSVSSAAAAAAAAKFSRLAPVLEQLEGVYCRRRAVAQQRAAAAQKPQQAQPQQAQQQQREGLAAFCSDLASYSRYSGLRDVATVRYVDLHNLNDLVCSVAYDRDDEYFATAGVSRRLKVFDFQSVLENDAPIHYPVLEINARSKLSCVVWNPYVKSNILCSDYDGTIQLWDACTKQELMQFDEHSRRVWSVDFATPDPTRFLSGSDDHTVKLWALNCEGSVATMDAKANVCSVQFHPTDSNIVACGAANYRVYLHDLRNTSAPLAVLAGHTKAVSYVRFLDSGRLVSAATDHQLRLWDLASACAAGRSASPSLVYRGHVNEKNFVGLSVSRDGYIACGSEDNAAYVYAPTLPMPVTRYQFSPSDAASHHTHHQMGGAAAGGPVGGGGMHGAAAAAHLDQGLYQHFVSSVAWSRRSRYLAVANSMGVLKVLETC